jgi:hypothetical protein
MNPRKIGRPSKETSIVDDFGVEEPVLEAAEEVKIVISDDQLSQPLEMFLPEPPPIEPAQRTAVLDFAELPFIQRPPQSTAPPMPVPVSVARRRPRRPILRFVGAVGIAAISIALAVIGGAAVKNRLDVSALSEDLAVVRTITPALRQVLPEAAEVARDSGAAGSPTGTTASRSATVAEPNSLTAPKKLDSVPVAAPRPRQATTAQPPTRKPLVSPRPSASSVASGAPTSPATPPALTVIERREESRPPAPAVAASNPSPAPPSVSSVPALPAVSSAPTVPAVSSAVPVSIPSPAPPPPAPVSAPSATPAAGLTAETRAVALALDRYQDAFSALDVNAAHAVWPSVDVRALAKAFGQLEEQTFDLEGCNITVAGAQAEADCAGNARYVRKVGNRALRVEPRRWQFKLRQTNDQWVIDTVDAR